MSRPDDIELRIREFFDQNLAELQAEAGHALSPELKAFAFQQVLLYWRRLRDVGEKVTDTEVHLNLPEQTTPSGRKFGIEGIVDIVREHGYTVMYDIKTHDPTLIQANLSDYERQLNVYAHIWQKLRGEQLDETAVLCTVFPDGVREAFSSGDVAQLERELARWEPIIPIPFDSLHVTETIENFGTVVDRIEDGEFEPPSLDTLKSKLHGTRVIFAVHVCRNCDARFSCAAYRTYAASARGGAERNFRAHFTDNETDLEREERLTSALDIQPTLIPIDDLS